MLVEQSRRSGLMRSTFVAGPKARPASKIIASSNNSLAPCEQRNARQQRHRFTRHPQNVILIPRSREKDLGSFSNEPHSNRREMFESVSPCFAFRCSASLNSPRDEFRGGGHDTAFMITSSEPDEDGHWGRFGGRYVPET